MHARVFSETSHVKRCTEVNSTFPFTSLASWNFCCISTDSRSLATTSQYVMLCRYALTHARIVVETRPSHPLASFLCFRLETPSHYAFQISRWALDVQEGIHDMLNLFIDLLIETLEKATEPPIGMLKILAMVSFKILFYRLYMSASQPFRVYERRFSTFSFSGFWYGNRLALQKSWAYMAEITLGNKARRRRQGLCKTSDRRWHQCEWPTWMDVESYKHFWRKGLFGKTITMLVSPDSCLILMAIWSVLQHAVTSSVIVGLE